MFKYFEVANSFYINKILPFIYSILIDFCFIWLFRLMTKSMQLPTNQSQPQQKPDNDMDHTNNNNNNNNNCIATSSKKKKKHKKKSKATANKSVADFAAKTQADMVDAMMNHHVIRHGDHKENHHASKSNSNGKMKEEDNFWSSTNNTEERQKIREFWLQLGEDERRSLVKVEKEAVLRKMKEQQKHSCNCSVCGKKRYIKKKKQGKKKTVHSLN